VPPPSSLNLLFPILLLTQTPLALLSQYGGGLHAGTSSVVNVYTTSFNGNSAEHGGGLYAHTSSVVDVYTTSFSGNSVDSFSTLYPGEDICVDGSVVTIHDTCLALGFSGTATQGAGLLFDTWYGGELIGPGELRS
jgi:predicted outer membrane repeat protein